MCDDLGTDHGATDIDAAVALVRRRGDLDAVRPLDRAVLCARGGTIAEAFGDGVMQLGLVLLHREKIVPFGVSNVLADLALAEDSVAGDDCRFERQALQQHERRRDLVLIGFDDEIADDRRQTGREGR